MNYKKTIPGRDGVQQIFAVEELDDHVILRGYLSYDNIKVDIPAEIDGKPVTDIGEDCFFNHHEIGEVSFPNTLRTIASQAFAMCKGIRELTIPDGVTEIGSLAFRDCTGLRRIVLPASLKVLKAGTFAFCYPPSDIEIVLNEGLEGIESGIFSSGGLNHFFTVRLPESVKFVSDGAFDPGVRIITSFEHDERWFVSPGAECIKEMIADRDVRDNIVRVYRALSGFMSEHIRGLVTGDELNRLFDQELEKGVFQFLSIRGVQCSPDPDNWQSVLEEYRRWQRNLPPVSKDEKPWLYLSRTKEESEIWERTHHGDFPSWTKQRIGLCASDKSSLFELLTAFGIPIEYFEPATDDTVFDERKAGIPSGAYGAGNPYTIFSKWSDHDNLVRDPAPLGKTFTLISDLGLKAVVTINETTDACGASAFIGDGAIEGYTTDRKRPIRITADRNGKIGSIQYLEYPDDAAFFAKYPLWQKSIEYNRTKHDIWRKALDVLNLRFYCWCSAQED